MPRARRSLTDMPALAMDRLSLHRRRLWRPWRRLGRRDRRMPAGVEALGDAGGRRAGLAGAGRGDRRPVAILRLSGIYGPGRNALVNLDDGTARRLVKPDQVFNRIHCDDIAGALWHLGGAQSRRHLQRHRRPAGAAAGRRRLCRVADGRRRRRRKFRSRPPNFRPWRGPSMARTSASPTRRSRRPAIDFRFPDYRAAFDHMWADGSWRDGEARSPMKRA